jgi:hypothetical protein
MNTHQQKKRPTWMADAQARGKAIREEQARQQKENSLPTHKSLATLLALGERRSASDAVVA